MTTTPDKPEADEPVGEQVVAAARGLCTLIVTGQTYQASHPVFQRAAQQEVEVLEAAMKPSGDLTLFFVEGQIRLGKMALEPGAALFRRTAQLFQSRGVKGLTFLPGVEPKELAALISLLSATGGVVEARGLSHGLNEAGVTHIFEQKVKVGIVGKTHVAYPPSERPARVSASGASLKAFNLEDGDTAGGGGPGSGRGSGEGIGPDARRKPIREFLQGVLGAVARREATEPQATDIIASEIEHRLLEKEEQVRAETAGTIRRLEQVKDVMLQELDTLHLAALILDTGLEVVAMNKSALQLLGALPRVEPGSPLERFIRSGLERQTLDIAGRSRLAHMICSAEGDVGNGLMLVCLE